MATYEIKNYIKLLAVRVDHFESHLIHEINTSESKEIEEFIDRFSGTSGIKIIMIEMNTQEIVTFDELTKYIKNAHIFDYVRHLTSEGNKILTADDSGSISIGSFVKYLLDVK